MKKVLLILVGLTVLAAAGATIYIASIDWNQHKDKIAAQFAQATGKQIVFDGPISFKILPSPYLNASNVKIFNAGPRGEPLMEIRNLVARLSLMPLLEGNFDVKRMVLESPVINIEVDDDGHLNWEQGQEKETEGTAEADIRLNSVGVEKATLNFVYPRYGITRKIDNLNGEVNAQSLKGPFRIEGNYVKDNDPEGFAISMGRLSESFSTTLNLVFTHPASKSYVRFDGNFQLSNKVLNGNVIIESEKLKAFVENNFKQVDFKSEYDYPLALTTDIAVNPEQLTLSNMVVKYGETQGAGSMMLPFNDGWDREEGAIKPRMDMAFNFTDFNLDPVVYTVREFIKKYSDENEIYEPDLPLDMLIDFKSVRTVYNGQPVKDFEASFDVIDNIVSINKLTAVLPGDTNITLRGDVSSVDSMPFYNLEGSFNSSDFLKTLNWMNINPTVAAASTYRKAVGNAKLSGTFNKLSVSPFTLTMDKSSLSGEAGIKFGERTDAMLVVKADMINFDNYINPLPAEEKEKNWSQRMLYRFVQTGFLNDVDLLANLHFDLAIYENMPFEKVDVQANLLNGVMEIEKLSVGSAANAQFEASGKLSGFGKTPVYENIKYNLATEDVSALINKFEFQVPNLNYKQLKKFQSKGIMTGNIDKTAIKAVSKLENLDFTFGGQIDRQNGENYYNGDLEIRHPDFVKMVNDFNLTYNPKTYSLGLFNLKTKFIGTARQFRASPLDFNIGYSSFSGDVTYDAGQERPNILTNLKINKFEAERFMPEAVSTVSQVPAMNAEAGGEADFLKRPDWSSARLNYDFYRRFDLSGNFQVGDLSYKDKSLKNAIFDLALVNGNAEFKGIKGDYKGGTLTADATLNMQENPALSLTADLQNIDTSGLGLSGKIYGLSGGTGDYHAVFNADMSSLDNVLKTLKGNLDVKLKGFDVKGWNLADIYADITTRETTDGLVALVKDNLQKGRSPFKEFSGKLDFQDGNFTFGNAVLNNSGLKIDVYGEGSLSAWTMDVLFNVKYDEPRYLPGYSFSMKGDINAPLTDVDVSALFNLYKSRQDKIAAQEKAVVEAEQNRLKSLAGEQKKIADALLKDVQERLMPDLQQKFEAAFSDKARSSYQSLKLRLEDESSAAAKISNQASASDLTDEIIAGLTEDNRQAAGAIEKIRAELDTVYLEDLKEKAKQLYQQLVENYNRSKTLMFDYNTARDGFGERLSLIVTDFEMGGDEKIAGWQKFIEDKNAALEAQNKAVLDEYAVIKEQNDAAALSAYNSELEKTAGSVEADVKAMDDQIAAFKAYTEDRVKEEENKYAQMLRREEIERKVEENTGVISIKKTGKSVTVTRDIEDIEKSEELASQDKVRVLDFSKDKAESERPSEPETGVVKKGRVIRK